MTLVALPLATVVVTFIYLALMESSPRQATLGKMVLELQVSDLEGRPLTLGRAIVRTLAKSLSFLTLGVGFILCGFSEKKQALHDIVAGSLVLRRRP